MIWAVLYAEEKDWFPEKNHCEKKSFAVSDYRTFRDAIKRVFQYMA
jgi:hypothetical protein